MIGELANKDWDVIVIGTGMGGGTVGRRLAEKGLSVLFLERGPNGPRAEQQTLDAEMHDPMARTVRGYWPKPMHAKINGRNSEFFGPVGAGVGGTSVFYAAALERPERHDLDHSADRPHPTGGWPVGYDQFQPYYERAEKLFHVSGQPDPLSTERDPLLADPASLTAGEQALMQSLRENGLNPYQGHMGVRRKPGCKMCLGFKCPRACKMDGRSAGVEPALKTGKAALIDKCVVQNLHANGRRITNVEAVREGVSLGFRARVVVLAAGALSSPRLLLASTSEQQPQGCANENGLVGKNLMFHLNEVFALWPKKREADDIATKAIVFRDHYYANNRRYGVVQAMGIDASYGEIVYFLNNIFDRSILRHVKPLRALTRFPAMAAVRMFGNAKIFTGILEDLPYESNRVLLDENDRDVLRFQYDFKPELLQRRREFRKLIRRSLRGHRHAFLGLQPELNFGHPCGTLKFGADPKTSVLDANCRAHGVENLYVADSSFMPTSFGVNPSLTIAANALRVADRIAADIFNQQPLGS